MSPCFRKFVVLFLSGWLLVMSGGYSTAVAAAVEHNSQCMDQDPQEGDANCAHGCAAHLAAHLLTLPDQGSAIEPQPLESGWAPPAHLGQFYSISSSLFLPPKVLLA